MKSLEFIKKNVSRRMSPLESKGLQDAACRRTGLRDFGDPPLEPALSKLLDSLENEADLSPLGRFLIRGHLLELLEGSRMLALKATGYNALLGLTYGVSLRLAQLFWAIFGLIGYGLLLSAIAKGVNRFGALRTGIPPTRKSNPPDFLVANSPIRVPQKLAGQVASESFAAFQQES